MSPALSSLLQRPRRLASLAALASPAVLAHEGHGLSGPHWHATDAWGFVVLAVLVALALWMARGKR